MLLMLVILNGNKLTFTRSISECYQKMNFKFSLLVFIYIHICTSVRAESPTEKKGNDLKIICQYHLHTWYSPEFRDYFPEVIDEKQCTHIVYTDRVRSRNGTLSPSLHDGKKLYYGKIADFRRKGIHVSIRFFKFNLYVFARTLNSDEERADYVAALVAYMEKYQFDGFDPLWGCSSCIRGDGSDPYKDEHTILLMRQLYDAFKPRGWLLSVIISTDKRAIELGFDIKQLSEYVEWMTPVPSYVRHNYTTLISPLHSSIENDTQNEQTVDWSINYLIEKGVPKPKIVLGTSTTTTMFQLKSAEENGLNAPSNSGWKSDFYEICERVKQNNWTVVHESFGSYAFHDTEWITYMDVKDMRRCAEYALERNIGGVTLFDLNGDDFQDKCGCGKYPLLSALHQVLKSVDGPYIQNCT